MKGAELIAEYLIANDIPYVFGICGHGNVGMLDALYAAQDRIRLVSRAGEVPGFVARMSEATSGITFPHIAPLMRATATAH